MNVFRPAAKMQIQTFFNEMSLETLSKFFLAEIGSVDFLSLSCQFLLHIFHWQ
jgi:hypothetical protein